MCILTHPLFALFRSVFCEGSGIAGGNVSLECDTPAKMAARAALHERQKPCFVKFFRQILSSRTSRSLRSLRTLLSLRPIRSICSFRAPLVKE